MLFLTYIFLHYNIKFSCAVAFTSGSYKLMLWVDCVCPQMSVAKVKNCWLQDSYPTVTPIMITPLQYVFRQANYLPLYSFVRQTKGVLAWDLSEGRFSDIGPQSQSDLLQKKCALFCNVENFPKIVCRNSYRVI